MEKQLIDLRQNAFYRTYKSDDNKLEEDARNGKQLQKYSDLYSKD